MKMSPCQAGSTAGVVREHSSTASRLLALLTRSAIGGHCKSWTPEEWAQLVTEATSREVDTLLYMCLRAAPQEWGAPDQVIRELELAYGVNALRNQRRMRELRTILLELRQRGIATVVLKGAYLAEHVYRDPALRIMSDLDILVRSRDLEAARSVLQQLGYAMKQPSAGPGTAGNEYHLPAFVKAGATPVELHWDIEWSTAPVRIDMEALWSRTKSVTIAGAPALSLGAVDLVLHLATHMAYHHYFGADSQSGFAFRPLFDLARSIESHGHELNWDELCEQAKRSGQAPFAYCALEVVRRLLDCNIPSSATERLAHGPEDRAIVGDICALLLEPNPLEVPAVYRDWTRAQGTATRIRAVIRSLFPSPQRMRAIYGLDSSSTMVYGFYLVRPVDLVIRRGAALAELVFQSRAGRVAASQEVRRRHVVQWIGKAVRAGCEGGQAASREHGSVVARKEHVSSMLHTRG